MDLNAFTQDLHTNSDKLINLLASIDENKLIEKQGEQWSILDIAEHIYLSDKTFIRVISQTVEKHHDSEELKGSHKIQRLLVDMRERKATAPKFLEPKGQFFSDKDFESAFKQQRESLLEKLANGNISDFTAIIPHPFLGDLTITDWLYVILHHTSRHIEQIKDRLKEFN